VALIAFLGGLVFGRELLPFALIGRAMPAIHVTAVTYAEVVRY
jgi:hypothetical protein